MSIESRVVAAGRRIVASPLWTGLAITLFFVLPTLVVPFVELWVSALLAVLIGPPTVVACFLLYGIYRRLTGVIESDRSAEPASDAEDDPLEALKTRYANDEIDDETFEQRLEQLLETDELARRLDDREQSTDTASVRNR